MEDNHTYREVIYSENESLLSKHLGIGRQPLMQIKYTPRSENEDLLQLSWDSEKTLEEIWQDALETDLTYEKLGEKEITTLKRLDGHTSLIKLDDGEHLLYTESTNNLTYSGPEYTQKVRNFIRRTHSSSGDDVVYTLSKINDVLEDIEQDL